MRGERGTHNDTAAMNIQTDADARVESAENFATMRLKIPDDVSHISPSAPVFPVMRMTMARASEPKGAMLNHAESSKDASVRQSDATEDGRRASRVENEGRVGNNLLRRAAEEVAPQL